MSPDPYNGSMDPANPQSFNRYSYVGNSPLTGVDPSGLVVTQIPCAPDSGADICTMSTIDGGGGFASSIPVIGDIIALGEDIADIVGLFSKPPFKGKVGPNDGRPANSANIAKTVTQNCLAQYNGSKAGKGVQFFSLYNLATNFKSAWPDWTVLPGLKILSLSALDKGSQAIGNTQILSVTGGASTEILSPTAALIQGGEKFAGRLAGPGIAGATGLDALVNAGCANVGLQAGGFQTPIENIPRAF